MTTNLYRVHVYNDEMPEPGDESDGDEVDKLNNDVRLSSSNLSSMSCSPLSSTSTLTLSVGLLAAAAAAAAVAAWLMLTIYNACACHRLSVRRKIGLFLPFSKQISLKCATKFVSARKTQW